MRAAPAANSEVLPINEGKPRRPGAAAGQGGHCGEQEDPGALRPALPDFPPYDPDLGKRPRLHLIQGRGAFQTGQWPLLIKCITDALGSLSVFSPHKAH